MWKQPEKTENEGSLATKWEADDGSTQTSSTSHDENGERNKAKGSWEVFKAYGEKNIKEFALHSSLNFTRRETAIKSRC